MKAVVKYGFGKGETEIRDVPVPEIGDDDILIEVKVAGVCGSDIAFDDGHHADILRPPVVLGHEFSGVICKTGKNVTDWKVGDPVVSENTGAVCGKCYACNTADYLACAERLGIGYGMDGGFTKYVRIPGDVLKIYPSSLMRIPEGMSFEEAAILDPCCNAYMAVIQESKMMPGDDIVVFGAGTLGLFCIQIANAAGAHNIICVGLSQDEERFKLAKKLGATRCIASDKEDAIKTIREITNGDGVGLVMDCAGVNAVMPIIFGIMRPNGQVVKIGYDERPANYSLDPLVGAAFSIKGHFGYDWVSWRNVMKLWQAGRINLKAMISHDMKVSEFFNALDLMRKQKSMKIILRPED